MVIGQNHFLEKIRGKLTKTPISQLLNGVFPKLSPAWKWLMPITVVCLPIKKHILVLLFVVSFPFPFTTSSPVSPNSLEKTNRCLISERVYWSRAYSPAVISSHLSK